MSGDVDRPRATGAALLEHRMHTTFGMTARDYEIETTRGPVPQAYLNNAIRIVKDSGVMPLLQGWDAERRKSPAGIKPIIPMHAVLVLFLLHVQMGLGVNYLAMARTLDIKFTIAEFKLLGIGNVAGDKDDWYQRIWQAARRMTSLIDPFPGPRNAKLKGEANAQFRRMISTPEYLEASRQNLLRIDDVCNRLVEASVRMLPADIWKLYKGNVAIDATRCEILGKPNPANDTRNRANADPFSGRYMREGSHGGKGAGTDVAAFELETAVMTWNTPGANTEFPTLITRVSFHNPGELSGHGANLVIGHQALGGFHRILVMADRAYNGEKVENFHIPLRKAGCELVIAYKSTELGINGHFEDLIMVEGNWYVKWMPMDLVTAGKALLEIETTVGKARGIELAALRRKTTPTKAENAELLAAQLTMKEAPDNAERIKKRISNRSAYRMVAKGFPDADGYQRFSYPNPENDLTQTTPTTQRRSITIPLLILEERTKQGTRHKAQPIKFLQKFPYLTEQWARHMGMRSLVEGAYSLLKLPSAEDIGAPSKRSGRGYAFQYLAMALASASSNVRRIVTFFKDEAERTAGAVQVRTRYRKDPFGAPLARQAQHGKTNTLTPPA